MSFFRRNRAAIVVLAVAVLFLAQGVLRGETQIVFRKAVNICMECIGLG
ncbi:MAG TPA: thioredoxin [Candidatus Agathobaculum merdipullorum]|nr:CD1871A family CXXC motif-containing protein [uncultured Agathobaculum sp.]HIY13275.1 thioredoxin [Candidatus Agathobaculum merdipullorum]